jgi:hypothetical protein
MNAHILCLPLAALALASTADATNLYQRDDGSAEAAIGYGLPQDYRWTHWFDAVGGADMITAVLAAIPSTTPPGTPITFCVWEDPNDDGQPDDLALVSRTSTVVQAGGTSTFRRYPLLLPAPVTGRFFVGAFLTEDGTMSPAALDDSTNPHAA